jgi:hypothetical protein
MRREIVDSLMCLSTEPSDELILIWKCFGFHRLQPMSYLVEE